MGTKMLRNLRRGASETLCSEATSCQPKQPRSRAGEPEAGELTLFMLGASGVELRESSPFLHSMKAGGLPGEKPGTAHGTDTWLFISTPQPTFFTNVDRR